MYQGGVKNITLYENQGIEFYYYDPQNDRAITNLTSKGSVILIENCQLPEFNIKQMIGDGGRFLAEYNVKFHVLGMTSANVDLINRITTSIYGWCFDVEFYDGTHKYYNTPLKLKDSEINPQEEMSFMCEMETPVPSYDIHLDYVPGVSTVPVYRWDTTLITWDTTLITWDYAL